VRSCITFAGTRVDQEVVTGVLDALRPVGVQAAFDALERSQGDIDEKRRSLEFAVEKARYEASRIERQYRATEPETRLVAGELEKRCNNALAHVAEMERRLEEAKIAAPQLTPEQREQLLRLGDDLEKLSDHPDSPVTLKKRILRTVLGEVVADTTDDPPSVHLKLLWAGSTHTEPNVRKNRTGYQNRINSREVTEFIRELALVCEDGAIVSIHNRLVRSIEGVVPITSLAGNLEGKFPYGVFEKIIGRDQIIYVAFPAWSRAFNGEVVGRAKWTG
jgi:hypothetical protein